MTKAPRLARALLLALPLAGCQTPTAYFEPAEQSITDTVDRVPGALYELRDSRNTRHGELRVWCLRAEVDDGEPPLTYIDLGVEIENHSDEDLRFVAGDARLRAVRTDEQTLDSVAPFEPGPTVRIAPDSVATTHLSFELPPGIRPRDIQSFRFRWAIGRSGDRQFTDLTSFVRRRRVHHPRPYWGYGPYWPYWGFGVGFHVLHHRHFH